MHAVTYGSFTRAAHQLPRLEGGDIESSSWLLFAVESKRVAAGGRIAPRIWGLCDKYHDSLNFTDAPPLCARCSAITKYNHRKT